MTRLLPLGLVFAAATAHGDPSIAFEKYQLANGLTVILSEDHRLPQVAVDVYYSVGAANQTPGRAGFAHLFEHMMLAGTKHIPGQSFVFLESIGSSGPENVNGRTGYDRTSYYEVVPSNELATALWLESDRMGFLLDGLDEKHLAVQRDVVSNELRLSYENTAYAMGRLQICNVLYPAPHPYNECVIGTVADVQAATVPDLKRFFKQYYGAANASLSIVGDFDTREVKAAIEKYFGPIPPGPVVVQPSPSVTVPLRTIVRATTEEAVAQVPRLVVAWNGVTPFSADQAAGDVLARVIGGDTSSRLYREAVVTSKVASAVSALDFAASLGGSFEIRVDAAVGKSAADLLAPIQQVVTAMKTTGPTQAEVDRAVRTIIAGRLRLLERTLERADLLNHYQRYVGDPGYLAKDLARFRAVTPQAVKAFAQKYLHDDRRLELAQVPRSTP